MRNSSAAFVREQIEKRIHNDSDLEAFCLDYYPDIKKRFSNSQERVQKINLLIELANHAELYENLLERFPQTIDITISEPFVTQSRFIDPPKSNKNNRIKTVMFGFIVLVILGLVLSNQKLHLSSEAVRMEYRLGKIDSEPETINLPIDFVQAIRKVGSDNVRILISREYDFQQKSWIIEFAAIEKRNNSLIAYLRQSEPIVQGWIEVTNQPDPLLREIALHSLRMLAQPCDLGSMDGLEAPSGLPNHDMANFGDTATREIEPTKPITKHSHRAFINLVVPLRGGSDANTILNIPTINDKQDDEKIDMAISQVTNLPVDLGTLPMRSQSSDLAQIPKIIIQKISSGDEPRLSESARRKIRSSTIKGVYKVTISTDGKVFKVEIVNSIDEAIKLKGEDQRIIDTIKKWRYKPIPVTKSFMQQLEFTNDTMNRYEPKDLIERWELRDLTSWPD